MSTFSSGLLSRHFWDVNTPIFTQIMPKKCVLLLLPKTTITKFWGVFSVIGENTNTI